MATEQEVYEAGGQKCTQQNLNIAFVFWTLGKHSSSNQTIVKNIIEFIKGWSSIELIVKIILMSFHIPF